MKYLYIIIFLIYLIKETTPEKSKILLNLILLFLVSDFDLEISTQLKINKKNMFFFNLNVKTLNDGISVGILML